MHILYPPVKENIFSNVHTLQTYKIEIRRNLLESMQILLSGALKHNIALKNSESENAARFILELNCFDNENKFWVANIAQQVKYLWNNEPAIREVYDMRSKLQLPDCARYFFDNIDRINEEKYSPTRDDILRARLRSTGIVEQVFNINNVNFKLLDVGGQRNERRKWFHSFEGVTSIIFVTAISEFDQLAFEDEKENRLQESLRVFDETINNDYFRTSTIILFMNKIDLFAEKIAKVHVGSCFSDYHGDNSYGDATEFLKNKFIMVSQDRKRLIFPHFTCATDTEKVFKVFEACKFTIFSNNLEKLGLN